MYTDSMCMLWTPSRSRASSINTTDRFSYPFCRLSRPWVVKPREEVACYKNSIRRRIATTDRVSVSDVTRADGVYFLRRCGCRCSPENSREVILYGSIKQRATFLLRLKLLSRREREGERDGLYACMWCNTKITTQLLVQQQYDRCM